MTYSAVARDPATGQLGVAVQSHYFSVGSVVPWAEAGIGAVATQSMVDVSYGPLGLALLRGGRSPADALAGLTLADAGRASRQVAIVDASGQVAAHTGDRCIAEAGHSVGDGWSVQANMMTNDTVWSAMASVMSREPREGTDLADRLLDALDAAEAEGGDIRGRQSAALVIVAGEPSPRPWERVMDVRVEDHADPLGELRRLVAMRKAYLAGEPGDAMGTNPELLFWQGLRLAASGDEGGRALLDRAYAIDDNWRELVRRLPRAGLIPNDSELLARLTDQ